MGNHGRSNGCTTCKEKHVKCDEKRPCCGRCSRLGYRCKGYDQRPLRIRFKDQTKGINEKHSPTRGHPKGNYGVDVANRCCAILPAAVQNEQIVATSFFLNYAIGAGRSLESTRGFFEVLAPVLASERHDSALFLAVDAIAIKYWRLWTDSCFSVESAHEQLTRALARLQTAIRNPVESVNVGTVLAALVLQSYENMSSLFSQRRTQRTHRDGALALLKQQWSKDRYSTQQLYMLRFLLHSEVSASICEVTQFPADLYCWNENELARTMRLNPSLALDLIGISIANHQSRFFEFSLPGRATTFTKDYLRAWWHDIADAEEKLDEWQRDVPQYWRPRRLERRHLCEKYCIPMYSTFIDIYPSIQIATIWNAWRGYRLILLKIKLSLIRRYSGFPYPSKHGWYNSLEGYMDTDDLVQDLQTLIDTICHSVPFYLGTLKGQITISDLTDPGIIFPSFHDLDPDERIDYLGFAGEHLMSRDAHKQHAIAQGAWQILGPLSHVLCLFSGPSDQLLTEQLRPGQIDWIKDQFLRVSSILKLVANEHHSPSSMEVFGMAGRIRKALRMTHGA